MRRTLRWAGLVATVTAIGVSMPLSRSVASEQDRCGDVTSLDVRSMSVEIPVRGMVQMDHGTGFSSDAGFGDKSRDWKITVVQDETLRPSASTTLRLVRFKAEHVTGSGAWDHVFIYQCRNGELVRLFEEKYLYGVEIRRLPDDGLLFVSGERMKGDSACCPSGEKRSAYEWDPKGMKYMLVKEGVGPKTRGPN